MKIRNLTLLLCTLLLLNACKKDTTNNNPFSSTTYQNLAPYNALGKPDNLLKDTISDSMMSFLNKILIKGQNLTISHPELFTNTAIADIAITKSSEVFLTFISGQAAYSNALAFYTYPTNQPPASAKDIKLITYIFPSAGHLTPLNPGDKADLGKFDVGTSIGIVLMSNAWDTTAHTLNNNAVHFTTSDVLNPETDPNLKRHAVLINYAPQNKLLIGFEDMNRTLANCDNDFDDLVFYYTVTNL